MCAMAFVCELGEQLYEFVLFFCLVGPENGTRVLRLGSRHLCPLSSGRVPQNTLPLTHGNGSCLWDAVACVTA